MKIKKYMATGITVALLCIVMFASFANANPTTVTNASGYGINGGTFVGNPMWVSVQDGYGPMLNAQVNAGAGMTCTMSASVNSGSYIGIRAIQLSDYSSPLTVWTAPSTSGPWTQAGITQMVSSSSWTWYYFISGANGQYIAFSIYNSAQPTGIYVDYVVTM